MKVGIVHGSAVDEKGNLYPHTRNRVDKAIEEYSEGNLDFLIMSGRHEADYMAMYAVEKGVLKTDIGIENKSRTTIENLCYSEKFFLKKFEVEKVNCITNWWHAPRVEKIGKIILKSYNFEVTGTIDERVKSEIEKDIKMEKIKLAKDELLLKFLYNSWPDWLKDIYGTFEQSFENLLEMI
jgi:uncharacterized SAM-binding protein YcdF (DUF218 family)